MAPLPKRKFSTARKGRRMQDRVKSLPKLVVCSECGKKKIPHRVCKYCNKPSRQPEKVVEAPATAK